MALPGTIDGSLWSATTGANAADIGISAIVSGTVDIVDPGTGDSDKYLQAADGSALNFDIAADADRLNGVGDIYRQSLVLYAEKTGTPVQTLGLEIQSQVPHATGTLNAKVGYVLQATSNSMPREGLGFYRDGSLAQDRLIPQGASNALLICTDTDKRFTLETVLKRHATTGYFLIYINGKCISATYGIDTDTSNPSSGWEITLPGITGIRWRVYPNIVGTNTAASRQHQTETQGGNVQWHFCPAIGGDHGDFDIVDSASAVLTRNTFNAANILHNHRTEAVMTSSAASAQTSVHTTAFNMGTPVYHNGFATVMLGDAFAIGAVNAGKSIKLEVRNTLDTSSVASITLNADGTVKDNKGFTLFTVTQDKRYNLGLVFGSDGTLWAWAYNMTDAASAAQLVWSSSVSGGWVVQDFGKLKITMSCDAAGGSGVDFVGYSHALLLAPCVWVYPDSLTSSTMTSENPDVRSLGNYGSLVTGQFESGTVPNGHRVGQLDYGILDWGFSAGSFGGDFSQDLDVSVRPFVADVRGVRAINTGLSINDISNTRSGQTRSSISTAHDAFINAFRAGDNEIWWGTDVQRPDGIATDSNWTVAEMQLLLDLNVAGMATLKRRQANSRIKITDVSTAIGNNAAHEALFTAATDDTHPNAAGYRSLKQAYADNLITVQEDTDLLDGLVTLYDFETANDLHGANNLTLNDGTLEGGSGFFGTALVYGTPATLTKIELVEGHNLVPPVASDMTIAGWFYLSSTTPNFGSLWAMSNTAQAAGINIKVWPNDKLLINLNGTNSAASTTAFTRDAWNYVEVSHVHGVGPSLYIGNSLSDSHAFTSQLNASTDDGFVVLSRKTAGVAQNAKCAQLGIWHKTFTTALRDKLYNGGNGLAYSQFGAGGVATRTVTIM